MDRQVEGAEVRLQGSLPRLLVGRQFGDYRLVLLLDCRVLGRLLRGGAGRLGGEDIPAESDDSAEESQDDLRAAFHAIHFGVSFGVDADNRIAYRLSVKNLKGGRTKELTGLWWEPPQR